MAWQPLLSQIIGESGPQPSERAAELNGHALCVAEKACFPKLLQGRGRVSGILLTGLSGAAQARLQYFAAALGSVGMADTVLADGKETSATLFRSTQCPNEFTHPWQPDAWASAWGQVALFAAQEVMSHLGHIGADQIAGYMPMILVRAASRHAARGVPADIRTDTGADTVEVLASDNRHTGFFLTREYRLRHPEFSGSISPPVIREVFVASDAAIVLPYDPEKDRVLLVEQFRMGPFGRGDPRPWMLEPVAGRVDPGETPQEAARRECEEEAGLNLAGLEHIASHYCSPGCSTEYFHLYLGLCTLADIGAGHGGLASENEDIRTHILSFEAAMNLITTGEADNGPLILSLLWLSQHRERLRRGA